MKFKSEGGVIIILGLSLGIIVLLISLAGATLEKVINDERQGQLRVVPVVIEGKEIYQLPHPGKLPGESFYGFKKIRNQAWEILSRNKIKKIELNLILADKRMSEALALKKQGQGEEASAAGREALNKLKYAYQLLSEPGVNKESRKIFGDMIEEKMRIYEQVFKSWGNK